MQSLVSTREERQRVIDSAVFRTISGDDWRRQLREARAVPNAIRARIREAVLAAAKRERLGAKKEDL